MKNVPIVHWSLRRIERFVDHNVEKDLRRQFIELLNKGNGLYEYFYEGDITKESFMERWSRALELIKQVYGRLSKRLSRGGGKVS